MTGGEDYSEWRANGRVISIRTRVQEFFGELRIYKRISRDSCPDYYPAAHSTVTRRVIEMHSEKESPGNDSFLHLFLLFSSSSFRESFQGNLSPAISHWGDCGTFALPDYVQCSRIHWW